MNEGLTVKSSTTTQFLITNSVSKGGPMLIVETKLDPNTTFIPTDPKPLKIYKNAPISVGVNMSSDAGGKAGLEFQLGEDSFFFSTRLDYSGFKVGLSPTSFDDADSNATSSSDGLKVGHLDVIANYIGNSGSINVGPL
jgi:hypothetical protein